ncbi:MAG: hypothetical protein RIU67_647 [Actinomycetota bacterium]
MEPRALVEEETRAIQRALDARVWEHDGVAVRRTSSGLGLFATGHFQPSDVIYSTGWLTVRGSVKDLFARTVIDGLITTVSLAPEHMVFFEGDRWLDVPGCFANHSCAPSTKSIWRNSSGSGRPNVYDQVALVEILPGDQITCDYTRFDWGDDGLEFQCECGAPNCYGLIDGFSGLPRAIQEQTADTIAMEALRRWDLLRGQE